MSGPHSIKAPLANSSLHMMIHTDRLLRIIVECVYLPQKQARRITMAITCRVKKHLQPQCLNKQSLHATRDFGETGFEKSF